jgi:hypothetical protein
MPASKFTPGVVPQTVTPWVVSPAASTPRPIIQAVPSRTPNAVTPSAEKHTPLEYQNRRITIGYIYRYTLDAPDPSMWDGEGGTVVDICTRMGLGKHQRKSVKECLTKVVSYIDMGIEYDGSRSEMGESSRILLIPAGSVEMQIIADSMEKGFGIRRTKELVNEHREENGVDKVGLSTVFEAYKKLKPVTTTGGTL